MQENKVVHFNLFRPENALFKQGQNVRAKVQIITCSNTDNCQLLMRSECACRSGLFGGRCPYGKLSKSTGYTRRASKYHTWCTEKRKKYAGIGFLKPPKALRVVGDYVFLPYAHMGMMKDLPWHGLFLKKEDFTVENIVRLVCYLPQSLFGGEIASYQKKIPPQFLKHLSEQMPELFQQVISKNKYAAKRYAEFSNIGRKAILETTTPNVGRYKDVHGGLWTWTGEILQSKNAKASFMLVSRFKSLSIVPEENQAVAITNERQVNQDTVFVE